MLTAFILLAAMDAVPTPMAARTTTPVVAARTGQTRTLADVVRQLKLGVKDVLLRLSAATRGGGRTVDEEDIPRQPVFLSLRDS